MDTENAVLLALLLIVTTAIKEAADCLKFWVASRSHKSHEAVSEKTEEIVKEIQKNVNGKSTHP